MVLTVQCAYIFKMLVQSYIHVLLSLTVKVLQATRSLQEYYHDGILFT